MDKKIKLLFTIPNFKTAGSQNVLLAIYSRLDLSVFDIYILIESHFEIIPNIITKEKILYAEYSGKFFKDVRLFKKILINNQIEIVHSWDYKSNFVEALASRLSGVKYVYTKKNNAWSKKWFLKSLMSSKIAYNNPDMKSRFFDTWLLKSKIHFIPHGVDLATFKPQNRIESNDFNLVCVGNIGINKNQEFLIRSMAKLSKNVHLHLLGRGLADYKIKLDNLIKQLDLSDRVKFYGYAENQNLPEVFRLMDVFVLASKQEGLPVSLIEAMACGLPILSSDSGGGARYLINKSEAGFLFGIKDNNEFVALVNQLCMSPNLVNNLGRAGIEASKQFFDINFEVQKYQHLYLSLFRINGEVQ